MSAPRRRPARRPPPSVEPFEDRLCPTLVNTFTPTPVPLAPAHAGDTVNITVTLNSLDANENGEGTGEGLSLTSPGGLNLTLTAFGGTRVIGYTVSPGETALTATLMPGDDTSTDESADVTVAVTTGQKQAFDQAQKNTLERAANVLGQQALSQAVANAVCLAKAPASSASFVLCKFGVDTVSAVNFLASGAVGKLAQQTPDPNFKTVAPAVTPTTPTVPLQNGVTAGEANAYNALIANEAKVVGVARALATANNRAAGAAAAGDSAAQALQTQAAGNFTAQLMSLLSAETALRTDLQAALTAAGADTITTTADDVMTFERGVAQNGLPAFLTQPLATMGADAATLAQVRQLAVVQGATAAAGSYPASLTDPALVGALQGAIGALAGQGPAGPGVYEVGTGRWLLRNENSGGLPDAGDFAYGGPGLIPVAGDWTGSGHTGIGVYEVATGRWLLKNTARAGLPDFDFFYGGPGLIPVVGDWAGAGHAGVGVYEIGTGRWLLRSELSAGLPDAGDFFYGGPGLQPVAGDWKGTGHAGIGVYEVGTGRWLLRSEVSAGGPDAGDFFYGGPGLIAVAGDWTGAGHAGVGVYELITARWLLRSETSTGAPDAGDFFYGGPGLMPVVGAWGTAAAGTPRSAGVGEAAAVADAALAPPVESGFAQAVALLLQGKRGQPSDGSAAGGLTWVRE